MPPSSLQRGTAKRLYGAKSSSRGDRFWPCFNRCFSRDSPLGVIDEAVIVLLIVIFFVNLTPVRCMVLRNDFEEGWARIRGLLIGRSK